MAVKGSAGLSMSTCSTAASIATRASCRYTTAGGGGSALSQRTTAASVGVGRLSDDIGSLLSTTGSAPSFFPPTELGPGNAPSVDLPGERSQVRGLVVVPCVRER